jgi:hypothetical protein
VVANGNMGAGGLLWRGVWGVCGDEWGDSAWGSGGIGGGM